MTDRLVIGLGVLMGCGATAPGGAPREEVCTLIACPDGFWIVTGGRDEGITVDAHTRLFGSSDGRAFACVSVPYDGSRSCGGQQSMRCEGVGIEIDDLGKLDSAGSCVHQLRSVGVTGMPKVVDVTFEIGGASIHRVFHPTYTNRYLNGSGCRPSCTSATERIP